MARKVKVDMTDVEAFVRCEEGEHIAILKEIQEEDSQAGNPMLTAKFEVVKGASAGAVVYEHFPLSEKGLWKLKGFLEAVGMKSEGRLSIDLDVLEGKRCIIAVIHEEYNGQTRAKIDSYKKLSAAKKSEPEDEDIEDEDDFEEEEEAPKKKKPAKAAETKKKKPAPVEEDDEDDYEEEEEEEEEKPAKKKKPAAKTPAKTPAKKKKPPVEEDDDDEWEDD